MYKTICKENTLTESILSDGEMFVIGLVYDGVKTVHYNGSVYNFVAGDLFCLGFARLRIENHSLQYRPYKELAITFTREELIGLDLWHSEYVGKNILRHSVRSVEFVGGCHADMTIHGIFNNLRLSHSAPSLAKRRTLLKMIDECSNGLVIRILLSNLDGRHAQLERVVCDSSFKHKPIQELATECHCSRSTFKTMFRKCYNSTPHHYFLEKQLEKAQMLLATTSLTMAEISQECEFSNPSYFARAFRTHLSMTPSEYRRLYNRE